MAKGLDGNIGCRDKTSSWYQTGSPMLSYEGKYLKAFAKKLFSQEVHTVQQHKQTIKLLRHASRRDSKNIYYILQALGCMSHRMLVITNHGFHQSREFYCLFQHVHLHNNYFYVSIGVLAHPLD